MNLGLNLDFITFSENRTFNQPAQKDLLAKRYFEEIKVAMNKLLTKKR